MKILKIPDFPDRESAIAGIHFSSKINELLKKQDYLKKITIMEKEGWTHPFSNCHGTVVFALGARDLFLRELEFIEENEVLKVYEPRNIEKCFFLIDDCRPGYVDAWFMQWFLEKKCEETRPFPGVIRAAYTFGYYPSSVSLAHTSIYLGSVNGIGFHFEQVGIGRQFRAGNIIKYNDIERVRWYKPHTFKPD